MPLASHDYPFAEVALDAQEKMRAGHTVHQKFTCRFCGARQTMAEPNQFFAKGKCEECGAETDLIVMGCNYVLVASRRRA